MKIKTSTKLKKFTINPYKEILEVLLKNKQLSGYEDTKADVWILHLIDKKWMNK